MDRPDEPGHRAAFVVLKVLSYVAHAAMAGAAVYAAVTAVRYWPGIGV